MKLKQEQLEIIIDKKLDEFKKYEKTLERGDDFQERYVGRIETLYLVKEILRSPRKWLENYELIEKKY